MEPGTIKTTLMLASVWAALLALGTPLLGACQGDAKKPPELAPDDKLKRHVEQVTAREHEYRILFRGTVDGVMTRDPIGYSAYRQGFQPNLSVKLENVGDSDVVNPWIIVNGKRNWRTVQDIVAEATVGCQTEREKAIALWEFEKNHRFHACTWDGEVSDPVKVMNVYGYTLCGNDAHVLSHLWRAAGLKVRRGFPIGHCTAEAFFDGAWHLLDGDEGIICLLRDNETIASEADIVRDHDLMKRTHTYNILSNDRRETDEFSASLHWYEGERKGEHRSPIGHTMYFTLRPGESLEWRWDHKGKQYTAGVPPAEGKWKKDGEGDLLTGWGKEAYDKLRNGLLRYAPNLRKEAGRRLHLAENVAWASEAGAPALHPAEGGRPAQAIWKIASPYVIVGAKVSGDFVRAAPEAGLTAELSPDGKEWTPVWTASNSGAFSDSFVLDEKLSPRGKPQYQYFLRFTLKSVQAPREVGVNRIVFETDVQMSALHLPELEVGENLVKYVDDSPTRQVRITHEWIERATMLPPAAPPAPIFPADGGIVEGTQFTFRWQSPPAPEGDKIVDYHFQLSARPDMRWTLSPNFNRLTSRTPSKGKAEWAIPYVGLLNPEQEYYWRVRARTDKGVWGPWSATWRFRCNAPGVPLDVRFESNYLVWRPNPVGRKPVRYKVYGSNEKGFTASDKEYTVFMGKGFCDTMEQFKAKTGKEPDCGNVNTPPNLLGETVEPKMRVIGADLTHPNANKAYYRVAAVDERGVESGPSDYAEAPRPFIFTAPPTQGVVGQEYRYQAASIFSIGHLTCKGGYNAAFWDREKLTYSLVNAPDWLTVDPKTGLVHGTPKSPGKFEVTLLVENNKGGRAEQHFAVEIRQ